MIEELESTRQNRLRAWEAPVEDLGVLTDQAGIAIPPPSNKTFEAEGAVLERVLTECLRDWDFTSGILEVIQRDGWHIKTGD